MLCLCCCQDWIQFEEVSSRDERGQSHVFEQMLASQQQGLAGATAGFTGLPGQGDILSCPVASGDDSDDVSKMMRDGIAVQISKCLLWLY